MSDHLGFAETRLIMCLLKRALSQGRFAMTLANGDIVRLAALDKNSTAPARRSLESRGLIQVTPHGKNGWDFELLDPETKAPFAGESGSNLPIKIDEVWGTFTLN